jgi:hypothetical protein
MLTTTLEPTFSETTLSDHFPGRPGLHAILYGRPSLHSDWAADRHRPTTRIADLQRQLSAPSWQLLQRLVVAGIVTPGKP